MAKKKKKSKTKYKKSALVECTGWCVYENGKLIDSFCGGDCDPCAAGKSVMKQFSGPDPPIIMIPCQPEFGTKSATNHKVQRLMCEQLPNGDIIYACRLTTTKKKKKQKVKKKAK